MSISKKKIVSKHSKSNQYRQWIFAVADPGVRRPGSTNPREATPYYLTNFVPKMHENEAMLVEMEVCACLYPLLASDPPMLCDRTGKTQTN